jgi:hypothetical protein
MNQEFETVFLDCSSYDPCNVLVIGNPTRKPYGLEPNPFSLFNGPLS